MKNENFKWIENAKMMNCKVIKWKKKCIEEDWCILDCELSIEEDHERED